MSIRFYPDTNAIHCMCSLWTPAQYDEKAHAGGYTLCLGHQTYELARSFLYNHSQEAVKKAFGFLAELECIDYLPDVNARIEAEVYLAETGMQLITVVAPLNRVAVKQELLRLAAGLADTACEFISKRESNVSRDKEAVTKLNQDVSAAASALDPKRFKAIKTYETLQKELTPGRSGWLNNFVRKKGHLVTRHTTDRILADPTRYPVLNTIVNSQEYLYYITAFQKSAPGKDTLDDFRQLVESATSDIFVTRDRNLLSQRLKIRPFKQSASWEDFKCSFEEAR